jgi:hypothetical protein
MVTWIQIRVREVLVTEAKINYGTVPYLKVIAHSLQNLK